MNKLILCLAVCFVLSGCRDDNQSRRVLNSLQETAAATDTAYPLLIDGGTKILYQFGHMTPDKGLKLYYDTIPNPAGGLKLDQSVRKRLLAQ